MLGAAAGPAQTLVDAVLGTGGYSVPPASDLARLEPLGEANTEPVFLVSEARVESSSAVGRGHLKLVLRAGEQRLAAFGLDMAERAPAVGSAVTAVGSLRADTWQGGEQVELRLIDFDS
jgi:single-stranded-DNA-specific exonuclease